MRLQRADRKFGFALLTVFFALILVQCIFVVGAPAYAENAAYEELISNYYSFHTPTRVAVAEGVVAVFDEGEVVLFRGDKRTVFAVDAEVCDKLAVSEKGVFLLCGVQNEAPQILSYTLEGEARGVVYPSDEVTDVAICGDRLLALSSMKNLKEYSIEDGSEAASYSLPSMWDWSRAFATDGTDTYFVSFDKKLFKKGSSSEKTEISTSNYRIYVAAGAVYYLDGNNVCVFGEEKPLLKSGSGDAAYKVATDFAVGDGKVVVADASLSAVKVFDLETGDFIEMIGSYGSDLKRLNNPVAISVKDGAVAVADASRVSVFLSSGVYALNGRTMPDPTDVVIAGENYFVVAGGVVYEYNASRLYLSEYGEEQYRFVAAAPDGTVYAASDRDISEKKAGTDRFTKILTMEKNVTGLNVGIGGKILYVMTGETISAYSRDGALLGVLETTDAAKSFVVDYRGNVFLLTNAGKLLKYARTLDGYAAPTVYDLATGYASFGDVALDGEGKVYVVADHNVLIDPKDAFGAFVATDSDFKDETPTATPLFVCEVVKDHTISYIAPDNFEDITPITRGTRLMCYATVSYSGDEYLRVETEKGTAYLPKGDVKVFSEGSAPFRRARCLLPAIGTKIVGVNLYAEPSHLSVAAGAEPLFASLGKEDVFDVVSCVAADESGKDVWGFYRVTFGGKTAYVLADEVVSVDDDPEPAPPRYEARVKSEALGKTVPVYAEASIESEVVARLTDGTEIYTLEPIDENKEFIQVLYEGEIRYVLSANLGQGGLSGGQVLAIVLSVVAVVGSVLTILILRSNKRHKRYHKE